MGFKTWSVGDVLTASDVNAYLMKQSVVVCTAGSHPTSPVEGMVIYETDTDRLLIYSGTAWVEISRAIRPAQAMVSRPAAQLVGSSGSGSPITWSSKDADTTGTMVDLIGAPNSVTIPFAGTYSISASMIYATGATGTRSAVIYKGAAILAEQKRPATNTSDPITVQVDAILAAGDVIQVYAFHTQGTGLNVTASTACVRHTGSV